MPGLRQRNPGMGAEKAREDAGLTRHWLNGHHSHSLRLGRKSLLKYPIVSLNRQAPCPTPR
jgi:hypothetical protein